MSAPSGLQRQERIIELVQLTLERGFAVADVPRLAAASAFGSITRRPPSRLQGAPGIFRPRSVEDRTSALVRKYQSSDLGFGDNLSTDGLGAATFDEKVEAVEIDEYAPADLVTRDAAFEHQLPNKAWR